MQHTKTLAGIRLCSFQEATPSANLARDLSANQWQLVDYETTVGGGTMLMTRNGIVPPPVTIPLNARGWHRLYVCLVSSTWSNRPGISLKLTDDIGPSFFCKSMPTDDGWTWKIEEQCEEYFWECADLTGQDLTVAKLPDGTKEMVGLMWVRMVPMTDEEVAAYKKESSRKDTKILHAHTDMDWLGSLVNKADDNLFAPFIQDMSKADVGVVSVEFYPFLQDYSFLGECEKNGTLDLLDPRLLRQREYFRNRGTIMPKMTEVCHSVGLKVYAALRIALVNCPVNLDYSPINHIKFVKDHPEFFCVDRDGEIHQTLSYAFPEVQDYTIGQFLDVVKYGFDGVTLFFHRGVMMLFEEPVIRRFQELYPGLDPRRLPISDPRLVKVHCELMGNFVRRLRQALDKFSADNNCGRKAINAVVGFNRDEDKYYGVDIEAWAEEGLIDSFIPSNMRVWEDDEQYRDAANHDLVDLEKYKEVKYNAPACHVKRAFGDDLAMMLENLPKHLDITRRTGVQCYIEVPWECTRPTEFLHDYACKLYAAGAEHISLWDCFHPRVLNRDEWSLVSKFGHKDELPKMSNNRHDYGTYYRVLSFNGISIAAYHPGWRG